MLNMDKRDRDGYVGGYVGRDAAKLVNDEAAKREERVAARPRKKGKMGAPGEKTEILREMIRGRYEGSGSKPAEVEPLDPTQVEVLELWFGLEPRHRTILEVIASHLKHGVDPQLDEKLSNDWGIPSGNPDNKKTPRERD